MQNQVCKDKNIQNKESILPIENNNSNSKVLVSLENKSKEVKNLY